MLNTGSVVLSTLRLKRLHLLRPTKTLSSRLRALAIAPLYGSFLSGAEMVSDIRDVRKVGRRSEVDLLRPGARYRAICNPPLDYEEGVRFRCRPIVMYERRSWEASKTSVNLAMYPRHGEGGSAQGPVCAHPNFGRDRSYISKVSRATPVTSIQLTIGWSLRAAMFATASKSNLGSR